jgi:hypothetical protein
MSRMAENLMQRHLIPVLLLLAATMPLAACSSSGGSNVDTQVGVSSHFMASDPTVIEVRVRDPLPAARVFLIDPNGLQTEAYDIQRDRRVVQSGGSARPIVGVGVGGGSSGNISTGIGIGFPVLAPGGSSQASAVTDSTAWVRISNPTLYGTTWQSWRLRVELDDGVNKRVIETLPPKPF